MSLVRFFTSLTPEIFGVRSVAILIEKSLFGGGKEGTDDSLVNSSFTFLNLLGMCKFRFIF